MLVLDDVVIVNGVRTPFGKFGGALRDISTVDLAATVLRALLVRTGVNGEEVNEVYLGLMMQGEAGLNGGIIARQALLKAGLPPATVSLTVDRACCSSLAAIQLGYRAIKLGLAEVVIAGGAENMGRVPYVLPELRWGQRMGPVVLDDPLSPLGYRAFNPVSVDAGEVALEHEVTREEQDEWALRSQQRYAAALAHGKFEDEIIPVEVPHSKGLSVLVDRDELPKPWTTKEGLARLPTVYGSPTVTAGNAPGLDTGAAAVMLASRKWVESRGMSILATIISTASLALEPRQIAVVPAPVLQKVLSQVGLTLDDVDLIEINEAFAAMPLVSSKILAGGDAAKLEALREKINVNGGAIAIGHPMGASGARILMTLANELRRRGGGIGAAAICGGLAQGDAAVIRVTA